jgi:hypothetical protein
MPGPTLRFPSHLTPLERTRLARLIGRIAADPRAPARISATSFTRG